MSLRKRRITKAEAEAFTQWFEGLGEDLQAHSTIRNVIAAYEEMSGVTVSRMFVSNVRRATLARLQATQAHQPSASDPEGSQPPEGFAAPNTEEHTEPLDSVNEVTQDEDEEDLD